MTYQESSIYKEVLTPREKKFFDDFVFAQQEDKDEAIDELKKLIKMNKFRNREQMLGLFEHTNRQGEIVAGRSNGNAPEKEPTKKGKDRVAKDLYGKGAYRRWKRKGQLEGDILTLRGQKFQVIREGKKFKLVVPGQRKLL